MAENCNVAPPLKKCTSWLSGMLKKSRSDDSARSMIRWKGFVR